MKVALHLAAPRAPGRERGVAALALTMALFFAMILGVAFVNRNLIFEQRASANQYRSTQSFEAAEAGLEWALAQLGQNQRMGPDCLPTADAAATSFRERYLSYDAATASFTPATWLDAGVALPLQPTCVRSESGWNCSCPSAGPPSLAAPAATAPAPAFAVEFQAAGQPGLVRAVAIGCTSLGGPCAGGADTTDASTRVQALFGLLPALRSAPAAALTARGTVDADSAGFGAHNQDAASGGLAIQAGGAVNAGHAHLTVRAGAAPAAAVAHHDGSLANLSTTHFFAGFFGIDKAGWARQPVVRRVSCNGDCTPALQSSVAGDRGASLVVVDGDLLIEGPATLGSLQQPIVIVAGGAVQLNGAVAVTGVLYGSSVTWGGGAGPGARVRGALISEGDYRGDATPEIVYDAAVLARLKGNAGTFVRVNGSWRDF